MRKNEVIYVPSVGTGVLRACLRYKLNGHRLGWWLPDGIFSHKYVLISAYYSLGQGSLLRKKYEIGSDVTLIVDSGGFQQLNLNEKLGQMRVLRHQEDIADIGFVLDRPPVKIEHKERHSDVKPLPWDEMIQCAKITVKNAKLVEEKRAGESNVKIYNVLQGGTDLKRIEAWYNIVNEANLDGWAIAPKPPSDPVGVARALIFAHANQFKRIHILGVSGTSTIPIISYMGKFFETNITFDTATLVLEAKGYSSYRFYYDNKKMFFGRRRNTYSPTKIKLLPCDCPVCSFLNEEQENPAEFFHNVTDYSTSLMTIHNLYEKIRTVRYLNAIRDDEDLFLSYLEAKSKRAIQAFNEINYYLDHGYEALRRRVVHDIRKQSTL